MIRKNLKKIFADDPEVLAQIQEQEHQEIISILDKHEKEIQEIKSVELKDGYTPVKGIDYVDGEDGQDYILTEQDKQDIASSIEVPIVEKIIEKHTKTIVEKPIVTNEIKEVAVTDKAEVIADKLNTLDDVLDVKVLKGGKDLLNKKTFDEFQNKVYTKGQIDQRWHGGGLSRVSTDATLTGDGTPGDPLHAVVPSDTDTLQTVTDRGSTTTNPITSPSFIATGQNDSGFLKGGGGIDYTSYLDTSTAYNTYVPYTGAFQNVDLGQHQITTRNAVIYDAGTTLSVDPVTSGSVAIRGTTYVNDTVIGSATQSVYASAITGYIDIYIWGYVYSVDGIQVTSASPAYSNAYAGGFGVDTYWSDAGVTGYIVQVYDQDASQYYYLDVGNTTYIEINNFSGWTNSAYSVIATTPYYLPYGFNASMNAYVNLQIWANITNGIVIVSNTTSYDIGNSDFTYENFWATLNFDAVPGATSYYIYAPDYGYFLQVYDNSPVVLDGQFLSWTSGSPTLGYASPHVYCTDFINATNFLGSSYDVDCDGTTTTTGRFISNLPSPSASTPNFEMSTGTGMYYNPGGPSVKFSLTGYDRMLFDSTALYLANNLIFRSSGNGSATAPAYSLVGDPNTGMYFPTNDTLAWATGGSEKMRLNATGLGIGTNAPDSKLHVYQNTASNLQAKIENDFVGYNTSMELKNRTRDWFFQVGGSLSATPGQFNFIDNTAGLTRLSINTSGYIGMGTTTPTSPLHIYNVGGIAEKLRIYGGTDSTIRAVIGGTTPDYIDMLFERESTTTGMRNWSFGFRRDTYFGNTIDSFQVVGAVYSGGTNTGVYNVPLIANPNGNVILGGTGTNTLLGNIGMGITSPSAKLHIAVPAGTYGLSGANIRLRYDTTDFGVQYMDSGWNYCFDNQNAFSGGIHFYVKGTRRFMATTTGIAFNIPVGYTLSKPIELFDEGRWMFSGGGTSAGLFFSANGTDRVRIKSAEIATETNLTKLELSGSTVYTMNNVGIGTDLPLSLFQVGLDNQVGQPMIVGALTPKALIVGTQIDLNQDSVLRLVRPTWAGNLYPSSVDFKMKSYASAGGAPYLPKTQLTIGLKASASFDVSDVVDVMTLKDNGDVNVFNRLTQVGTFAGIHFHDASTAQPIATGATYTQLTAFTDNDPSANATSDATNDKVTITKAGKYLLNWHMSFKAGSNNVQWKIAPFLAGTEVNNVHQQTFLSTGSDSRCVSASGIITATANQDVDLRVKHDNGGSVNITPIYGSLTVTYIGE